MPRRDDLGHPVPLPDRVRRAVSLVPSLSEALAATDPGVLVGVTDWCPPVPGAERLRGTKNPHVRRIVELAPDLVVANREENRERHVRELRAAGIPVWVTDIRTVPGALASLHRLLDACGLAAPGWLAEAGRTWAAPAPAAGPRVAVPVWRDPWMFVGADTYAHDVLTRLGAVNVPAALPGRYPEASPGSVGADLVLLPDEPYPFGPGDGPEAFDVPSVCVPGRDLTWYGPAMTAARARLSSVLER
ncbi:helical backbone metal receptor [Nocardiopsis changdeensis]|uniref:helical backbone metal receptor n=1 Tax=Nocardiopsis changdeensis TaxID=2831969 RepID=UPI003F48905A